MSIITVNAGGSIQTAINSAVSGDIIEVQVATFDIATVLSLSNHGSSSNPITIRSQNYASLPNGRVAPSDASNMPRLRSTNGNSVFVDVSGGSYWVLDGLEVTDNSSIDIPMIFDLRHGGKTKISRVYFHPKETNPTWDRAANTRIIWYEGSAGLTVEKSYYTGVLGYDLAHSSLTNSVILNSNTGRNVTFDNNFLAAHYGVFFTGGAGVSPADISASVTGGASVSGATLSTVSGLSVGQIVRIDYRGTITKSGSTWTRTTGDALSNSDITQTGSYLSSGYGLGTAILGTGYTFNLRSISGDVWTFAETGTAGSLADGVYNFEVYQAAMIDTINSGTGAVTWSSNSLPGSEWITRTPSAGFTKVSWVTGDGDNAADWTVTRNTFYRDPEFVTFLINLPYGDFLAKGIVELKHIKRLTLDGNIFTGHPNTWFLRQYNQDGSEPWSTIQDITITNNYWKKDPAVSFIGGQAVQVNLGDPYRCAQPGKNITVSNNLVVGGWENFTGGQFGSNIQCYHNTIINDGGAGPTYHSVLTFDGATSGFVFRDNIVSYRNYGAQCLVGGGALSDCWPSGTWSKNVAVDTEAAGVTTDSTWGAGSILPPVPTAFSGVGFVDQSAGNYRLSGSSAYKGAGTGGTDPGIDQDALEAALGGSVASGPTAAPSVKLIALCV